MGSHRSCSQLLLSLYRHPRAGCLTPQRVASDLSSVKAAALHRGVVSSLSPLSDAILPCEEQLLRASTKFLPVGAQGSKAVIFTSPWVRSTAPHTPILQTPMSPYRAPLCKRVTFGWTGQKAREMSGVGSSFFSLGLALPLQGSKQAARITVEMSSEHAEAPSS